MLQVRRRVGDVQAGDPQHRRLQIVEALLGQPRRDLGAVPAEARRLVHHDGPPGAPHRLGQRRVVQRRQRPQVDDLDVPALLGGGLGRLERGGHHRAVRDEGDVRARPADDGLIDGRAGLRPVFVLLGPVAALGLEEHDGIGAADRLAQQPVGVGRGARGDDAQPGRVDVVGLRGVAMVLDAADPAAVRHPDHDRQRDAAPSTVAHLGQVAGDLLEGRVGERVELHLDDRDQPVHRHADGGADDARLGQRACRRRAGRRTGPPARRSPGRPRRVSPRPRRRRRPARPPPGCRRGRG